MTVEQQIREEEKAGIIRQLIEKDPKSEVYQTYRRRNGSFVQFTIVKLNGKKYAYLTSSPDPESLRTIRFLQLGA